MADEASYTCKPPAYKTRNLPESSEKFQRIIVGVRNCLRRPPNPEELGVDLTGRYEDEDGTYCTAQINHAGYGVMIWMGDVRMWSEEKGFNSNTKRKVYVYAGEISAQNDPAKFDLWARGYDPESPTGHLLDLGDGRIEIKLKGWETTVLKRVSKAATLSSAALDGIESEFLRSAEHLPLTNTQVLGIRTAILDGELSKRLRSFLDIKPAPGYQKGGEILAAAKKVNDHLAERLNYYVPHPNDLAQTRGHALEFLRFNDMNYKASGASTSTTRSLYEWLAILVYRVENYVNSPDLRKIAHIRSVLGIRADEVNYEYDCTLDIKGVDGDVLVVSGQAFWGTMTIKQVKPPVDVPVNTFEVLLVGAGAVVGAGIKLEIKCNGTGYSNTQWQPQEIPGSFTQLTQSNNVGVIRGVSDGYCTWILEGAGSNAPMTIEWGVGKTIALEMGKELGTVSYGEIRSDGIIHKIWTPKKRPKREEDSSVAFGFLQSHFELGSATLSYEGEEALRILCATELKTFRSPNSGLVIVGQADRVDEEWYNRELSLMRAENTLQAIKDILGKNFKIKPKNVQTFGFGELQAKLMGQKDGSKNPEMRRVHILLNGRVATSLRGPTDPDD